MNCEKLILYNADGTQNKTFEIGDFYENDPTAMIDSINIISYGYLNSGWEINLWVGKFSKPIEKMNNTDYITMGCRVCDNYLDMTRYELFYSGQIFAKLKQSKKLPYL